MLQWKEDGSRVRSLPAAKVLAWILAQGFVLELTSENALAQPKEI